MDRELVLCAKINFENLERSMPIVTQHPFYIIAKAQLDEALGGPKVEDILEARTPPRGGID